MYPVYALPSCVFRTLSHISLSRVTGTEFVNVTLINFRMSKSKTRLFNPIDISIWVRSDSHSPDCTQWLQNTKTFHCTWQHQTTSDERLLLVVVIDAVTSMITVMKLYCSRTMETLKSATSEIANVTTIQSPLLWAWHPSASTHRQAETVSSVY